MLHPDTLEEYFDLFGLGSGNIRVCHEHVGVAKTLRDKPFRLLDFVGKVRYSETMVALTCELALENE